MCQGVADVGVIIENLFDAAGLGVGEEHLTEGVAAHHLQQLRDTTHVQFVENIIK